eukprot:GCRY01001378.1.p1 GENE.GCRY01001378.1~~GCRY01001378.1.p1  ORF type:complete len:284 (+),score=60.22 GCRY01001378.1:130-981(+)
MSGRKGAVSSLSKEMQFCYKILEKLHRKDKDGIFHYPVKPTKDYLPDYLSVVKHPMDFSTIKDKILSAKYSNHEEFSKDVLLTFSNAVLYNGTTGPSGFVGKLANDLKKMFEKEMKAVDDLIEKDDEPPRKKIKKNYEPMSWEEKKQLGEKIGQLEQSALPGVVTIIQNADQLQNPQGQEVEIDLNTLETETLRQIEEYVNKALGPKKGSKEEYMPWSEKKALSDAIHQMDPQDLPTIVHIISDEKDKLQKANEEEVEIDLNDLKVSTLRKIQEYVNGKTEGK